MKSTFSRIKSEQQDQRRRENAQIRAISNLKVPELAKILTEATHENRVYIWSLKGLWHMRVQRKDMKIRSFSSENILLVLAETITFLSE